MARGDLIQAIAQNVPSFNAQAFGGDSANLTLSAKLHNDMRRMRRVSRKMGINVIAMPFKVDASRKATSEGAPATSTTEPPTIRAISSRVSGRPASASNVRTG